MATLIQAQAQATLDQVAAVTATLLPEPGTALMTLAERFPRIRFMRGVCTDLIPSFDEIGLPTLMLYRGGKQLDILVRITDELGPNFADRDLVFYLNKYAFTRTTPFFNLERAELSFMFCCCVSHEFSVQAGTV